MFTSLTMMVVLGLSPEIGSHSLKWEHDYRQARSAAVSASKPLAVFVGAGAEGWRKVVHDCCLDSAAEKTLAERYVVVYVNQDTDDGRKIAESLQLSGKQGLVISDRTGKLQAFRQEGDLTASDLSQRLTRYADPAFIATTTESNTPVVYQSNYVNPFRSSCPFCH
jgi:hypothetical protein